MSIEQSIALEELLSKESKSYLCYFSAFHKPNKSLSEQIRIAQKDKYFCLLKNSQVIGFYCLRGLDENYSIPSFGLYVSSKNNGRGYGTLALKNAENWCKERLIKVLMLKVDKNNINALNMYRKNGFKYKRNCNISGQMIFEKELN